MKLSDYDYELRDSSIAVRPPAVRGSSRLLVLNHSTGAFVDRRYNELADLLQPEDLLVLNNTKVIKARLRTQTTEGSLRELLLLEKHAESQNGKRLKVMYRRKLKPGMQLFVDNHTIMVDEILGDGLAIISSESDLLMLSEKYGSVPLPPYMHRESDENDIERYQTVFAKDSGSVAAPTASLNMTDALLEKLKSRNIGIAEITLHVGLGTFLPIRTDDVTHHIMHKEYFEITAETAMHILKTKKAGGRVVAVGTTVTRALEYAAVDLQKGQGAQGEADIFIYPGYTFRMVDAMVTNFHAPKSTVLMMAAAFAGWNNLKNAYEHAMEHDYKFLSYGDSMLITS